MKKENKYLQIYPIGEGVVSIGSGFTKFGVVDSDLSVKLPSIDISMNKEQFSIGEDLKDKKVDTEQHIKLAFRNLAGLEVLQKAIDFCRDALVSEARSGN